MSDPFEGRPFPRAVLIGAALMIGFVILAAAMVRYTGVGGTQLVLAPIAESRELLFVEQDDGATWVRDASDDQAIAKLHSGRDGFILGVMRGMERERNSYEVDLDAPYLLSLRSDGRLIFEDPSTGRQIDIRAFGSTQVQAFSALLRDRVDDSRTQAR